MAYDPLSYLYSIDYSSLYEIKSKKKRKRIDIIRKRKKTKIKYCADIFFTADRVIKRARPNIGICYNHDKIRCQLHFVIGKDIFKSFCRFHNNEAVNGKYDFIKDEYGNRVCVKKGCNKFTYRESSPFCLKHSKCTCSD